VAAHALDLLPAQDRRRVVLHDQRTGPITVGALRREVERWQRLLDAPDKALIRIDQPRRFHHLCAYLAALRLGHSVVLVDGTPPMQAQQLDREFRPDLTVVDGALRMRPDAPAGQELIHPQLGVLLSTSGSTGRPKLVRLSYDNLRSNAEAIAQATRISRDDRVTTSLPMDFAFGLSLVNSHLVAGASVALATDRPSSQRFWWGVDHASATTVGLVPSTCRTILAWRWTPARHPSLTRLLVAGGRLDSATALRLAELLRVTRGELLYMYGQAEATARISCLPPHLVASHPGSVGRAIPGGEIRIVPSALAPPGQGEIEFTGPNVMMGYGRSRADLALGDVQGPSLRTGDLGRVGPDGLLYVHGRVDRQVKVLGRRVDLSALEATLTTDGRGSVVAVLDGDDRLALFVEGYNSLGLDQAARWRQRAADHTGLPAACFRVQRVAPLPRTPSGKIAYGELSSLLGRPVTGS
jgi:acyl-coenzyme A synthetase/AMP-(fatty) acid ligase